MNVGDEPTNAAPRRRLRAGLGDPKSRTHRFLLVGLALNIATTLAAIFAWASVVTRELPVITLAAQDSSVCEQWRPIHRDEWSTVQVDAWVTSLVKAAMVQDSRLVKENLQTVSTMLAPSLRTEFRRAEPIRMRFAETAKMNIQGSLTALTIDCGDNPRFSRESAPWYCIAYGSADYKPAVGPLPKNTPPPPATSTSSSRFDLAPSHSPTRSASRPSNFGLRRLKRKKNSSNSSQRISGDQRLPKRSTSLLGAHVCVRTINRHRNVGCPTDAFAVVRPPSVVVIDGARRARLIADTVRPPVTRSIRRGIRRTLRGRSCRRRRIRWTSPKTNSTFDDEHRARHTPS